MSDDDALPTFPVDDATLAAVSHALGGAFEVDDDGNHQLVGADYSLNQLLDFLGNTMGEDPNREVIDPGDPLAVDPPGIPAFLRGITGAAIYVDTRPHYSPEDVIAALIAEIQRLRLAAGSSGLSS